MDEENTRSPFVSEHLKEILIDLKDFMFSKWESSKMANTWNEKKFLLNGSPSSFKMI